MKSKAPKHKAVKKTRHNIVKDSGEQTTMDGKLEMAMGQSTLTTFENKRDCAAMIRRSQWLVESKPKPDAMVYHLAKIGCAIVSAIVSKNHGVIKELAAQVQHGTEPRESELHRRILTFCVCHDCGTESNPADPRELTTYLKNLGQSFSAHHEGQVPRSLWTTCDKLGVVLIRKKGRPRNVSR